MTKALSLQELDLIYEDSRHVEWWCDEVNRQIEYANENLIMEAQYKYWPRKSKEPFPIVYGSIRILPEVVNMFKESGWDVECGEYRELGWVLSVGIKKEGKEGLFD